MNGEDAKNLDIQICNKICSVLQEEERTADLQYTKKLAGWLNWVSSDFVKEIFTTNYDLVVERSLEALRVPYFDGFVGSNEPFFIQESLDNYSEELAIDHTPPKSWIRLWKLHGSLSWYWREAAKGERRIIRSQYQELGRELVIYPSSDKYESSKQLPYVCYLDRLKRFLTESEGLMIVTGYSFSDFHINSVLFDGIKRNNRIHVLCMMFKDSEVQTISESGNTFMNMTVIGPKKVILRGILGDWVKSKDTDLTNLFWNDTSVSLNLGDFKELVKFMLVTSGNQEKLEADALANP